MKANSQNNYRKLMESVHTPDGLNDRVLFAARREAAQSSRQTREAARKRPWLFRTAVCAACALVLVLGGFSLRPAPVSTETGTDAPGGAAGEPVMQLTPTFGLTAYAAMADLSYGPAADGSIAFSMGEGCATPDFGDFTGCLFQVAGENIASVSLSIDRGGLYRYQLHDGLTDEEMAAYRQAMADGTLAPAAISQRDDGTWYMPEMTALGASVQEDYDPEARYGFWVSPEEMAPTGLGISIESQMDADFFDGAVLTITVASSDGTEKTRTYRLHTGSLKVEWLEDHYLTVLPELAEENDPCVYGIYAVPEN